MRSNSSVQIAIVHHWLVMRRGGERVLEALAELFPDADLFTLVVDRQKMQALLPKRDIRTSLLQYLPNAARWYPYYLPLYPAATERLDVSGYQLVITSDAATLKGIRTDPGTVHICYCYTPMRYVWSGYDIYYRSASRLTRLLYPAIASWLRRWDYRAAQRVTYFVAISHNVAERIRRYYGRESTVIYPPVDTERFAPARSREETGDYFLAVSQLVPYKRLDLAVEAFNRIGKPLVIIGEGSERQRLERQARSNIRFLGFQADEDVPDAMQACRALVFPGEEDFGIVMAEAQACGRPVIAFAQGGAREIVRDGVTGILFQEQTVDSLIDAVARCENSQFDPAIIRGSALRFSRERFLREFAHFVECALDQRAAKRSRACHPTAARAI